jgi:AraC-like DNA-binding protein
MVRALTYQPPAERRSPVEVMSFARLRGLNDGATVRADFHVIALIRRGRGTVEIDFESYDLAPGSAVWIRPGAVHCWADLRDLDGDLVLFVPTAPVTPAVLDVVAGAAGLWTPPAGEQPLIRAAVRHLRAEYDAADGVAPQVLRLLLDALVLRLAPDPGRGGAENVTFRSFREAVEEDFRTHHHVDHYARRLGYSTRTLSRSAAAATGRTAKQFLSDRLLLEAKRLLIHDGLTPAQCARRLGFSDAANFSAYFLHGTGMRPGAWQSSAGV